MLCSATLLLVMLTFASFTVSTPRNFVVYSDPIELRYGQVNSRYQRAMPLPADVVKHYADGAGGGWMAITGYELDIVRIGADGSVVPVPLYETYLHHPCRCTKFISTIISCTWARLLRCMRSPTPPSRYTGYVGCMLAPRCRHYRHYRHIQGKNCKRWWGLRGRVSPQSAQFLHPVRGGT